MKSVESRLQAGRRVVGAVLLALIIAEGFAIAQDAGGTLSRQNSYGKHTEWRLTGDYPSGTTHYCSYAHDTESCTDAALGNPNDCFITPKAHHISGNAEGAGVCPTTPTFNLSTTRIDHYYTVSRP